MLHDHDTLRTDLERCAACADRYPAEDGWGGLCASCVVLLDEHDAGRHDRAVVITCLACLAGSGPAASAGLSRAS